MIPETLWQVFSNRWISADKAPADAAEWLAKGYLCVVTQGKIMGYAAALPAYRLIVGD